MLDWNVTVQSQTPGGTLQNLTHATPVSILFIHTASFPFPQVPLNKCFPAYAGGTDADESARYILSQFMMLDDDSSMRKIYAS